GLGPVVGARWGGGCRQGQREKNSCENCSVHECLRSVFDQAYRVVLLYEIRRANSKCSVITGLRPGDFNLLVVSPRIMPRCRADARRYENNSEPKSKLGGLAFCCLRRGARGVGPQRRQE